MGNNVCERIRVDPLMKFYIESETKKLAEKIKRETGLAKVTIPFVSGTQWVANQLLNNKALVKYKVRKTARNQGVIEFM